MAADELRRRVDDEVRAELQRLLQQRRGERVVDDHARPGACAGPRRWRRGRRSRSSGLVGDSTHSRSASSARDTHASVSGGANRSTRQSWSRAAGLGDPGDRLVAVVGDHEVRARRQLVQDRRAPRPCRRRTRPRARPRGRRSRSRTPPTSRCPRCGCRCAPSRARSSTPAPAACSAARRAHGCGRRRWPTSRASKQAELLVAGLVGLVVGHEHQLGLFDHGLGLRLGLRRRLLGRRLGQQVGDPREVGAQGGEHRRRI